MATIAKPTPRWTLLAAGAVTLASVSACGSNVPPTTSGGGSTGGASSTSTSMSSASSPPSSSSAATAPGTHPTEFNPPGDIPDNAVFVGHTAPGSTVHFSVPEGWAQSTQSSSLGDGGTSVVFTDKYNSIAVQVRKLTVRPTIASVKRSEIPGLRKSQANFVLTGVSTTKSRHGTAVHLTYLADSAPNPVTGKVVRDAVEQYDFWHNGQEAVLSLSGPQHADNVDPWRTVSDSLRWH